MPWSLRHSLFQLWCCARSGSAAGADAAATTVALAGARRERRKLVGVFGKEMTHVCIEYEACNQDANDFDRAFETRDLEGVAALLESDLPIERLIEPKHPWAEDPRTVGALAAMFIAILASSAAHDDPEHKAKILAAGGKDLLVAYLGSDEPDRVQAAVVALSYLADDCAVNDRELYEAGAMPMLIKHLSSSTVGLTGAAASTLRHICMESAEYCEAFIKLGGLKGFVNLLEPGKASHFDPQRSMLEAVWNLEDVIADQDGNVIERYAVLANQQGALKKLDILRHSGEKEVSGAAEKVFNALALVQEGG